MFDIPSMQQIIAWLGWGNGIGAIAGVSAVLTVIVILTPVIVGLLLHGVETLQFKVIGAFSHDLARFFVNYLTFPGVVIHEMSHLFFAVVTGAEVRDVCFFGDDDGHLGHVTTHSRGPWFVVALQYTLIAIAPIIVGLALGYFLLWYIWAEPHPLWANVGLWYLLVSIINHCTMSESDIEGYFRGVWIFVIPLFLFFFILGLNA